MQSAARLIAAGLALAMAVPCGSAMAEDPPVFWAVTGVAANDVLNLRDVPSADSKSLARIPPTARGLKHLGCRRNQPALEDWMRMSAAQRRDATMQWCRVEYHGTEGWVAGRFLKPDRGPAH
jgi:hypothetical protein